MKPTLTYCTNVHPGETLAQVESSLDRFTVPLAAALAGPDFPADRPFPVGLYLSAAAARELGERGRIERFRGFLQERRLAVVTLNCFPYGGFHAERVKLDVYRPTWLEERRVEFTIAAAEALAQLAPTGTTTPISTLPGSCKRFGEGDDLEQRMAANLVRVAVALDRIARDHGHEIVLCLEPEPFGTLETSDEAARFFTRHVFGEAGRRAFVAAGGAAAGAESVLRRHLGVCFDACHQAVQFEPPEQALARLRDAGIRIGKIQLSSALSVRDPGTSAERRAALERYVEPRYLHQAIARSRDGSSARFLDLDEFLEAAPKGSGTFEEVRVHFHVPIDRPDLGPLGTTQEVLRRTATAALAPPPACFEVETYTFPVLPDRPDSDQRMVAALAQELRFAREITRPNGNAD